MKTNRNIIRLTEHKKKALIATLAVEVVLIILLFRISFPPSVPEEELRIRFLEEDFDFDRLKEKKVEIPDISEYLNKSRLSSLASNEWQDEAFESEENDSDPAEGADGEEEHTTPAFASLKDKTPGFDFDEEEQKSKAPVNKIGKSFKGKSSVKYYVKGRYKIHLLNPVYTCPDYMSGVVRILIKVDRNGKVVKAQFDPENSTAHFECLIETALKYSYQARFNRTGSGPEWQEGYIEYIF